MREIKFRAWHEEAKEYCEGSTSDMFDWLQDCQPVVLEQFTGLRDCDGVEIYEGDIISTGYSTGIVANGEYDEDEQDGNCTVPVYKLGWHIIGNHGGKSAIARGDGYGPYKLKVIGNIHQNPELIK